MSWHMCDFRAPGYAKGKKSRQQRCDPVMPRGLWCLCVLERGKGRRGELGIPVGLGVAGDMFLFRALKVLKPR